MQLSPIALYSFVYFVGAGVFDLLSLELELLELLELLAAVLVLASLELLFSPGEELALPSVVAGFLLSSSV